MDEQPTKKQKFKQWVHDHKDSILVSSVITVTTAAYVAIVVAATKQERQAIEAYNDWADDMNRWLNEERKSGNYVYQLSDGRYLKVAADAPQETVIK